MGLRSRPPRKSKPRPPEHPEDDEELATPEWFRETYGRKWVEFGPDGEWSLGVLFHGGEECGVGLHVEGIHSHADVYRLPLKTRRQVRRLMEALAP